MKIEPPRIGPCMVPETIVVITVLPASINITALTVVIRIKLVMKSHCNSCQYYFHATIIAS